MNCACRRSMSSYDACNNLAIYIYIYIHIYTCISRCGTAIVPSRGPPSSGSSQRLSGSSQRLSGSSQSHVSTDSQASAASANAEPSLEREGGAGCRSRDLAGRGAQGLSRGLSTDRESASNLANPSRLFRTPSWLNVSKGAGFSACSNIEDVISGRSLAGGEWQPKDEQDRMAVRGRS